MATKVLRELADGWIECEDGQGLFYHNTRTKESTDAMPPSLAANKVLRELPGGWLECEDAQGVYYYNSLTGESSEAPPVGSKPQQPAPLAADSQVKVLRELPGTWLECQDAGGIFYFNQVTKQSSDTLPFEAMQSPTAAPAPAPAPAPGKLQVLQQLGGNWLQCQDNRGIFYINSQTKQTSVDLPAELAKFANTYASPPLPATKPKILQELSNNWQKCQDEQGIFYFNKATQQFSENVPPECVPPTPVAPNHFSGHGLQQSSYGQQAVGQLGVPYPQQIQPNSYQPYPKAQNVMLQTVGQQLPPQATLKQYGGMGSYAAPLSNAYVAPQPATSAASARKKMGFGEWALYEDQAGAFFVHVPTGRQFEQPPEECLRSYQASKAAGLIH